MLLKIHYFNIKQIKYTQLKQNLFNIKIKKFKFFLKISKNFLVESFYK